MRDDVRSLLERQAAWQLSRARLPWSEKLRVSVAMRRGMIAIRKRPAHRGRGANTTVRD